MNTTKSVYNRLFQEDKVELASERVELANVKEIPNKLKKILDTQKKLDKVIPQIETLTKNKIEQQKLLEFYIKESNDFVSEIDKQIKQLGLDESTVPNLKSLKIEIDNSKGYINK
jgi:molecular chaperone DnaK (HSP70)